MNTAPQGRPEQGWPIRQGSPEAEQFIDRLPEDFDEDPREAMSGQSVMQMMAVYAVSVAAAAAFFGWVAWMVKSCGWFA